MVRPLHIAEEILACTIE